MGWREIYFLDKEMGFENRVALPVWVEVAFTWGVGNLDLDSKKICIDNSCTSTELILLVTSRFYN